MVISAVAKYMEGFKRFGVWGSIIKMYSVTQMRTDGVHHRESAGIGPEVLKVGEMKFGNLMGQDQHGNKYYENKDYPHGQHRWVEYADIHNYDSSTVTAAWHPWLHHMSDHTPATSELPEMKPIRISSGYHTPYDDFVAPGRVDDLNRSTWRPRGAGVGNIFQKPGEPELYYKQPGHPLNPMSKAGGRFNKQKSMETWDPADPKGDKTKKLIRELKEI